MVAVARPASARSPTRALRATSLLEVMVASAILLAVLASATMAVGFGMRHIGHTRRLGEAERVAAMQLEELLIRNRRGPLPPAGTGRFDNDGRVDADGAYRMAWSLEPGQPVPEGARLSVEVSWDEDGRRAVTLRTYLETRRAAP